MAEMAAMAAMDYLDMRPPAGTPEVGALLCLHAFPLNARMWEAQQPLVAHGWRILAPHWLGLQRQQPEANSFDEMAMAVLTLLDRLQVERPVVCGVSMGGYLAFALLRQRPSLARGLVLCDTRAEADPPQAREGRLKMLTLLEQQGVAAVAEEMMPRLLGETTRRTRPEVVERVRQLALSNRAAGVAGVITAMMSRADSTGMLAAIDCPTLIAVGEEDVITPLETSRAMHAAIPGSRLVVFERTGHLPNLEQAERFNDAVSHFLVNAV